MSLVGLLVTICLLLGMGIVIALVLFFPYSTVNQSSWEPVFRSYDENIKAVSKSHLLTALLDRYERYVRPLVSPPTEGKAPLPMTRSPEYLETSKLLQRMVSPHFSYTKMFPGNDQVFVLSVRTFDVFSEEFKRPQNMTRGIGTYSPLVGKVVLFRVPAITLLNKNESLNLTSNEAMGLNVCWSTFLPGSPVNVAFSNGYKQMAFVYRIIVPGGVRYRIRYYPRIECSPDYAESPSSDYYQKYSELTLRADTEYAKLYDDVYVPAYAYVGALAVGENRLAYTLVYDVYAFRVVEKVAGKWRERDDVPVVNRQEAVYSFCSDLFFVDRGDNTLLIAFTRDGNSLSKLTNHIEMFELNNGSPSSELSRVYNYDFQTIALTFTLGDLESPPEAGSLLAISADKDLAFVSKTSDHSFFMELPQGNKSAHFPVAVSSWTGNQAIAALKDLSIIATYVRDSSSITFFATSNSAYLGTKEMSLSQLPKSLQKKKIVDMVLMDNEMHSGWKQNDVLIALLFEGGDILKIFVNKEELLDIDEWTISFMEFPSSSLITMLVTTLLILIPLFLGLRISVNREGVGNIFQPNNPPQPAPAPRPANN